jgi:predicted component of type VI protein secretion system
MSNISKLIALVVFVVIGSSCSMFKKKAPDQLQLRDDPTENSAAQQAPAGKAAESVSKKDAITVVIKADPQLNRFGKNAHTLFLCLYQLKDPNGFNQLAQEKGGVSRLIECGRFDATVASVRQLVVQPGQELKEIRDRAEGARFIGVATGYYGMGKEKVTELSSLHPAGGGTLSSGSLVHIDLGPYEITGMKVEK